MLFNLPNGIQNSFSQPQKPLLLQVNNYENGKDRTNEENTGNFPDLSRVFRPQSDMNGSDLFYGDHYNQVMEKTVTSVSDQYANSQDLNQLVNSFQSFVTGEQDCSEYSNVPQQEDNMANKWGGGFMQGDSSAQMQRQLDFARERNNGTRKQLFKQDSLQDLTSYNLQTSEYSPQPKFSMGNHIKVLQRENTCLPFGVNHYPKHRVQQSPLRFKPHMQKEKKRMAGYFGDNCTARLPSSEMLPEEKRQALSQNPFCDLPARAHPQRFDRENNMIPAQFMPLVYGGNDPRRCPNPNFSPRGSLLYRGGVPNVEMADVVTSSEMSGGFMSRRGESAYHSMSSVSQGGPMLQLYFHLDECYDQWRSLEKERKRTEIVLSKTFPSKRTTSFPNSSLPKTPPNPTRVDHLIINQMREQARVSSLLDKMECLSSAGLNANIYNSLSKHHMAICVTSTRRKEEILNMSHNQRQHVFTEDRDTMLLVIALKDLSVTTRKLRTAVWCALQITLPKPVPRLEPPVSEESLEEKGPGPASFEGYSYRI
ncbi:hypothetical protein WMY93_003912 [Mugilogobius chulae]|uniref:Meiosis-specific coiled-coil domain-containing protein MEIOC n=1 Tax=Mugilogobius chulae TaxID=88201 RepID=A0AAW0PY20_9GOBI